MKIIDNNKKVIPTVKLKDLGIGDIFYFAHRVLAEAIEYDKIYMKLQDHTVGEAWCKCVVLTNGTTACFNTLMPDEVILLEGTLSITTK